MNRLKKYILVVLLFLYGSLFAINNDSLFISNVKQFIFSESEVELVTDFYTTWGEAEKPYIYLYVSLNNKVERPEEVSSSFIFFGNNEEEAKQKELKFIAEGYHTFIYKTFANSSAKLNYRFLSYPEETKCFIMLHEFVHNFISRLKLEIPYDFNEALCDVIGNYGTIEFLKFAGNEHLVMANEQKTRTEKIYRSINKCIDQINRKPGKAKIFNLNCEHEIKKVLNSDDLFLEDRFNYKVNNAYLLKNKYYSENYFLVKKVLLKHKTLRNFFKLIKNAPSEKGEFKSYMEKFM